MRRAPACRGFMFLNRGHDGGHERQSDITQAGEPRWKAGPVGQAPLRQYPVPGCPSRTAQAAGRCGGAGVNRVRLSVAGAHAWHRPAGSGAEPQTQVSCPAVRERGRRSGAASASLGSLTADTRRAPSGGQTWGALADVSTPPTSEEGEALIELNCFPGWGPRLMLWVQVCRMSRC